jgi:hypothetical protein
VFALAKYNPYGKKPRFRPLRHFTDMAAQVKPLGVSVAYELCNKAQRHGITRRVTGLAAGKGQFNGGNTRRSGATDGGATARLSGDRR